MEADDVTVHCPFVYGSISFWLGRKADESATHRWSIYVRGAKGEDLSYFISKVVFFLHESFAQSVRTITEPPFEVTENGWGEFDARIRVHFKDPKEEPIEITHPLKLYPPGATPPSMKKPVCHEFYDEVCFVNPSADFFDSMQRDAAKPPSALSMQEHLSYYTDAQDIHAISAAQNIVSSELISTFCSNRILVTFRRA